MNETPYLIAEYNARTTRDRWPAMRRQRQREQRADLIESALLAALGLAVVVFFFLAISGQIPLFFN
jgi:hypothetical protein